MRVSLVADTQRAPDCQSCVFSCCQPYRCVSPSLECATDHRVQHHLAAHAGPSIHCHRPPFPHPVSHSVRINVSLSLSAGIPPRQRTNSPSTNLMDMKAGGFDPLFTNPHTGWYILSSASLFAVLEKSDREASQLAPSVPLLSYREAAGFAGFKDSHWWAVLCRTKALLSNRWDPLQDDFWWITAVIVLCTSSFLFLD